MEFNELISDFATRHGIEGLSAEDGVTALDIDGIVITLAADGDALVVAAEIGEPPAEGRAEFADTLLEANQGANTILAKNHETGRYILVRRLAFVSLDSATFDASLEEFVNQAEIWRKFLADFRPFAKAADEMKGEVPVFGAGGFMQV